ncbi:hypothetical protein EVA_16557, partial [gut metagenome]
MLVHTAIGLREPHFSISGTSDLIGLSSSLPVPYSKSTAEAWPLSFNLTRHENAFDLDIHSFGHASITLRFEKKGENTEWSSGAIALGLQQKMPLGKRIDIALTTPELNLNAWLPYAEKVINILQKSAQPASVVGSEAGTEHQRIGKLGTVHLLTDQLKWYDKLYPNVEATLRRFNQEDWHFRIGGNQLLSGSITYESAT